VEEAVVSLIGTLYQIYFYVLIAYVLLSWIPNARDSFIGEMLGKISEPYLSIFRRFIPPIGGMIDISPIVALFALRFVVMGITAIVRMIIPG